MRQHLPPQAVCAFGSHTHVSASKMKQALLWGSSISGQRLAALASPAIEQANLEEFVSVKHVLKDV